MKENEVEYEGHDLESMDLAVNYHRWIYDLFSRYLGSRIVEVGAGSGSFSRFLLESCPERLDLVEPSQMFRRLNELEVPSGCETLIRSFNATYAKVAPEVVEPKKPDTFVYINVLEHIEDDLTELRLVHDSLAHNGHICIFVPAIPFLLSDFDRQIGHFRRYSRSELLKKCERAGFTIDLARGFDLPGVVPWLLKYRLMRSLSIGQNAVKLYDRAAVPLIRPFEDLLKPPIGKNLLVVAQRS